MIGYLTRRVLLLIPVLLLVTVISFGIMHLAPGAPTDTTDDFQKLSEILKHLARWGFVSIAPDLSWLASDFSIDNWIQVLADAAPDVCVMVSNAHGAVPDDVQYPALGMYLSGSDSKLPRTGHQTGGRRGFWDATPNADAIPDSNHARPVHGVEDFPSNSELADHLFRLSPQPAFALSAINFDFVVSDFSEFDLAALALREKLQALLEARIAENAVE